jgi:tripartite-type tricarboxylate transporter receptor subunit TctC
VIDKLQASIVKALETPAVKNRLASQAIVVMPMTQQQFVAYIRADAERWKRLLREGRLQMLD